MTCINNFDDVGPGDAAMAGGKGVGRTAITSRPV